MSERAACWALIWPSCLAFAACLRVSSNGKGSNGATGWPRDGKNLLPSFLLVDGSFFGPVFMAIQRIGKSIELIQQAAAASSLLV